MAELGRGYGVYMTKCSECHEHRVPGMYLPPERHQLIAGMSEFAGLSKAEEKDLQKYLERGG